ncbi:hypothetical protein FTUN_6822 [Frigoriglobus tundricola]|uniref:Uncharacterized protein n=1 Tax=Frigoriglobus tundricola TaxID=2774151 RepID=A0A6M5Z0Q6_9BACT|nr:hypothetical protein FTUN_6822 [Frigoriglobus tundricola]
MRTAVERDITRTDDTAVDVFRVISRSDPGWVFGSRLRGAHPATRSECDPLGAF